MAAAGGLSPQASGPEGLQHPLQRLPPPPPNLHQGFSMSGALPNVDVSALDKYKEAQYNLASGPLEGGPDWASEPGRAEPQFPHTSGTRPGH